MPIRRLGQAMKDRGVVKARVFEYEFSNVGGGAAFGGLGSPSSYALVGGGGLRPKRRRVVARMAEPHLQLISVADRSSPVSKLKPDIVSMKPFVTRRTTASKASEQATVSSNVLELSANDLRRAQTLQRLLELSRAFTRAVDGMRDPELHLTDTMAVGGIMLERHRGEGPVVAHADHLSQRD